MLTKELFNLRADLRNTHPAQGLYLLGLPLYLGVRLFQVLGLTHEMFIISVAHIVSHLLHLYVIYPPPILILTLVYLLYITLPNSVIASMLTMTVYVPVLNLLWLTIDLSPVSPLASLILIREL